MAKINLLRAQNKGLLIAKLTRQDVVDRAYNIYPLSGYIFQAVWWGSNPQVRCAKDANGYGYVTPSGPYVATECSGYTSWCWGLTEKMNTTGLAPGGRYSQEYITKVGNSIVLEECFPGIVYGDMLWRQGHVGIYVGNNTYLHASSTNWNSTTSGHGMSNTQGNKSNFTHCLKFDSQYSGSYDPEIEDPDDVNLWDGNAFEPQEPPDISDMGNLYYEQTFQYTKRRTNMKFYRRF